MAITAQNTIGQPPAQRRRTQTVTASSGQYSSSLSIMLIAPLFILLFLGFFYPVGSMLAGSLFDPDFTLRHYIRIFTEPLYLQVLFRTLKIALLVTIAALIIGYPVAYAMARLQGRWALLVAACVLIPLWTSVLVRSYAWIILLQRNGIINDLLTGSGAISDPLRLIYNETAVIVAMTHVLLPFTILPIFGSLKTIPRELPQAAFNLGARSFSVFFRILLPLSLPGVFAGVLMTFILALGFYITPALIGGPATLMMATLIGQQTTVLLDWPFAGALATILLLTTLIISLIFRKALAFNRGFGNG